MKEKIYRARIDQPSTLQPLHNLNGAYCIVRDAGERCVDIYFTEGPVHSSYVPRECLSQVKISN